MAKVTKHQKELIQKLSFDYKNLRSVVKDPKLDYWGVGPRRVLTKTIEKIKVMGKNEKFKTLFISYLPEDQDIF